MTSHDALIGAIDLMIERLDEMDKKLVSALDSLKKLEKQAECSEKSYLEG